MSIERSFYEPATQARCAEEIAALPEELRLFLQSKLSINAPIQTASDFPAYVLHIEFAGGYADAAMDVALIDTVYRSLGLTGVIGLIAAELVAFWESIEFERKRLS